MADITKQQLTGALEQFLNVAPQQFHGDVAFQIIKEGMQRLAATQGVMVPPGWFGIVHTVAGQARTELQAAVAQAAAAQSAAQPAPSRSARVHAPNVAAGAKVAANTLATVARVTLDRVAAAVIATLSMLGELTESADEALKRVLRLQSQCEETLARIRKDRESFAEPARKAMEDLARLNESIAKATGEIADARSQAIQKVSEFVTESHGRVNSLRETVNRDVEGQIEDASALLRDATAATKRSMEELIAEYRPEIDRLLGAARNARAEAGLSVHWREFDDAARRHGNGARMWLLIAGVLLLAAMAWLVCAPHLFRFADLWRDLRNVSYPVFAVYFFANATLFGLALLAVRVYRAELHNVIVNRHRATVLKSFTAIVDGATGDEQLRTSIIMQATQTIFAPQPTGHWSGKGGGESDSLPTSMVALLAELGRHARKE